MMLALEIIALLAVAAAALIAGAIVRNGVPISAPPGAVPRIAAYLGTNVAETRDDHRFPELTTRRFGVEPHDLFRRVRQAMDGLGWNVVETDDSRWLRAEVRSPLLGFIDDLEARVLDAGDGESKLEVRSSSRVGRGDLGANAGHILSLHAALDVI